MKKCLAAAIVCAVSTVGFGGSALAGEVTGNGKDTPVRNFWDPDANAPASICAFSGLNDTWGGDPEVPDAEGFTRTQNWGQIPKAMRDAVRAGNSPDPHLQAPNLACNPSGG